MLKMLITLKKKSKKKWVVICPIKHTLNKIMDCVQHAAF